MMDLRALYDQFIAEGYNNFYIEGMEGPRMDDVHCLGYDNGNWIVYYYERGQKSSPEFSSPNQEEAIAYYREFLSGIEHWHLVVFTRLFAKLQEYKGRLDQHGIRTIENHIPHYRQTGDVVYRLFVVNKDIFEARKLWDHLPYKDEDLTK